MALAMGAIEHCLELLAAEVRADERLSEEFERSIPAFFHGAGPSAAGTGVGETLLAARRHLEWFLVEHHSPSLRGGVAERITDRFERRVAAIAEAEEGDAAPALELALDALRRSHTGLFQVEPIRQGGAVWLRDLTGFGSFALGDEDLGRGLLGGEVLVGRLYPAGDGLHLASPAAAVLDGATVAGPLQRDLERIRGNGARAVVRVSQAELEAMFFTGAKSTDVVEEAPADPHAEALERLRGVGFSEERAQSILAQLATHPRDPGRLLHGGSDVFGEILESVAFDTSIDLDRARRVLLEAWELVSVPTDVTEAAEPAIDVDPAAAPDVETERLRAIDAFAQGRAKGGDPTELLRALESRLGLPPDEDEPEAPVPDFPGVVAAMIDEMRWELGATDPSFDPSTLDPLKHFADFARPIGVFEELRGHDMFQFATFWLQEKLALTSDAEAVALVGALRAFCEWALDAHEVDLGSEFLDALNGLETSLPRMRAANAAVNPSDRAHGLDETGDLYEILTVGEGPQGTFETSSDRVRASSGDAMTVVLPDALRPHLVAGDRVRGRIALTGEVIAYCCYPPESAALAPR